MALSRSLATAVVGCFFIAATAHGQQDSADKPTLESYLKSLGQLAKEANELKETSRWKEFRSKYSEAGTVHQQAADELAKQQKALDEAKRRLDAALSQIEPPQIMIQAVLAEAKDLDESILKAACTRVNAEAVFVKQADGKTSEPDVYAMNSEQANRLLATIEKRRTVQVMSRPSILAVDGQIAEITIGQVISKPRAVRSSPKDKMRIESVDENIGIIVSLIPTIEEDHQTQMELIVDNSALTGSTVIIGTDAQGKAVNSPVIDRSKMQTTLKTADGRTILVAIKSKQPADELEPTKTTLVLLTPRIVNRTADAGEILHH